MVLFLRQNVINNGGFLIPYNVSTTNEWYSYGMLLRWFLFFRHVTWYELIEEHLHHHDYFTMASHLSYKR